MDPYFGRKNKVHATETFAKIMKAWEKLKSMGIDEGRFEKYTSFFETTLNRHSDVSTKYAGREITEDTSFLDLALAKMKGAIVFEKAKKLDKRSRSFQNEKKVTALTSVLMIEEAFDKLWKTESTPNAKMLLSEMETLIKPYDREDLPGHMKSLPEGIIVDNYPF